MIVEVTVGRVKFFERNIGTLGAGGKSLTRAG